MRVKFYIVYCCAAVSVNDMVSLVQGEGGAGYIFFYGGKEYVAAAAFSLSGEAQSYADSMARRGAGCSVLPISRYKFNLENYNASQSAALYENNLSELYEMYALASECVYMLEGGSGEGSARSALRSCVQSLTALLNENRCNCFTSPLAKLIALAADCAYSGVVLAREVRYFQLSVADAILNTSLT